MNEKTEKKKVSKLPETRIKLDVTLQLSMPYSDSAFDYLVANLKISKDMAKDLLSAEALLRGQLNIKAPIEVASLQKKRTGLAEKYELGPAYPVVTSLVELAKNPENAFNLLELFYGIYSCVELAEPTEFSTKEIIEAMDDAIGEFGIEEFLKYPSKILEFLPKSMCLDDLFESFESTEAFERRRLQPISEETNCCIVSEIFQTIMNNNGCLNGGYTIYKRPIYIEPDQEPTPE